jgi:hypothetical protein
LSRKGREAKKRSKKEKRVAEGEAGAREEAAKEGKLLDFALFRTTT